MSNTANPLKCPGHKANGTTCGQPFSRKRPNGWCGMCIEPSGNSGNMAAAPQPDLMAMAMMPGHTQAPPGYDADDDEDGDEPRGRGSSKAFVPMAADGATPQQRVLLSAMQSGTPTIIWGLPGIGKTETIKSIARDAGAHMEVVVCAIYEPADIGGQPYVVGDHITHLAPPWADRLIQAGAEGKKTILFVDELDKATPAQQNAALRLIRERVVGDKNLPADTMVVAAANPPELGGWDLSAPLSNRFLHLQWEADPETTISGLSTGIWGNKAADEDRPDENLRRARIQYRAMVGAYLRTSPTDLIQMPKSDSDQGGAWPSPRSWEAAINTLAVAEVAGCSAREKQMIINGSIGPKVGIKFASFVDNQDLPDPEYLLSNPETAEIPTRADKLMTALSALSASVASKMTQQRVEAALRYMDRACKAGRQDAVVPACRPLMKAIGSKGNILSKIKPETMMAFTAAMREAHILDIS